LKDFERLRAEKEKTDSLNRDIMAQIADLKSLVTDFKTRETFNKRLLNESKQKSNKIKDLQQKLINLTAQSESRINEG
jgi:hypothetical protein